MLQPLTLPGNLDALKPVRDYASDAAKAAGLSDSAAYNLCLAVDEIATNVVTHGYEEAGINGNLTISAKTDCGKLIVELKDRGKSYDPNKHHIPTAEDLSLPLEERGIGGLGILLAFDGVDDLQYESSEYGNTHRFVVNLPNAEVAEVEAQSAKLSDERRKLGILLSISRSLGQEIELDRLLALIVAEVTSAMEAERSSLLLYDEEKQELYSKVAEGMSTREIRVKVGSGIAGATAKDRTTINIPQAYADARFNPSYDKASGFHTRSILSAPIINQNGRLLGVVQVLNKINQDSFTAEDENFLEAICIHLGIALERAEMIAAYVQTQTLKQSLQLAREIQMGLIPKDFPAFPNVPQIDIYGTIEPALEVGGDLYDFFLLDGNRICFIVGDVSDKGIPASLFMAMARTAFRMGALSSTDASISSILQRLNDFLCESNHSQMFVTVFAGILDLRDGSIEYADGGHEPPFIVRARGGAVEIDKVGGLALGFIPGFEYKSGSIELEPGDSLVLYTDGITEAMNPQHALFGADRILDLLGNATPGISAQVLSKTLLGGVAAFVSGAHQSDDITLLVLKYNAQDTTGAQIPV